MFQLPIANWSFDDGIDDRPFDLVGFLKCAESVLGEIRVVRRMVDREQAPRYSNRESLRCSTLSADKFLIQSVKFNSASHTLQAA